MTERSDLFAAWAAAEETMEATIISRKLTHPQPGVDPTVTIARAAFKAGYKQGWDDREADILERCERIAPTAPNAEPKALSEEQIKQMAERFLQWPLPEDFNPDGGITFEPIGNKGTAHEFKRLPYGTNLLSYVQALEMVRFMVEGFTSAGEAP